MQSLTDTTMLAIALKARGSVTLPAPAGRSVFLYVVEGTVTIGGETVEQYTRVEFDQSGDEITLTARGTAHVLYGHAPQIEEPVVAHAPFVMSSYEEVVQAARDFQTGCYN